jgi:acylglycerol lipase
MIPTKESNTSQKKPMLFEHQSISITSAQKDATFYLHVYQQVGTAPKIDFIFLHGALAHAMREIPFFQWLIKKYHGEIRILAPDFVGHGESSGPRAYMESFNIFVEDFFQVLKYQHETSNQAPFFVMGHSMGALTTIKASFENPNRWLKQPIGFIFSNPCIKPHQVVELPFAVEVLEKMSQKMPLLRLPRVHKGEDLVQHSIEANLFDTDHLIPHFMTTRMASEIIKASLSVRAMPYFYQYHCLFLLSDNDVVVDTQTTDLFIRAIDKKWTTVHRYLDTRHEVMHEHIQEKVWQDIYQWQQKMIKEIG